MSLSEKSKTHLWTILSLFIYGGGFFGLIALAVMGWSKNAIMDTSDFYLTFALVFLAGFPVLQFIISRILKSKGNLPVATGIYKSVLIEVALIILMVILLLPFWLGN